MSLSPVSSRRAAFSVQAAADEDVDITYVGHSTFLIETPGGVSIATDYSGWYAPPKVPDVVDHEQGTFQPLHTDAGSGDQACAAWMG